jgi:type I restriction enzyme, S subunit
MITDVKPGYKQTEVGVIPEDWSIALLEQYAQVRSGIAKNANIKLSDPIRVHYLRVANVQDGFLDLSEMSEIEIERSDLRRFSVVVGDVLMNEGGDRDKLGRGCVWSGQYNPCVHQNHVFVVRCSPRLHSPYLTVWTRSAAAKQFFINAGSQTTNLASINKRALGKLPIPLPPTLTEQQAIAGALSDADALIESLEQLVAKKRQIKNGTMQDLLTGQKRLPGFTGDWETRRLGDFIDLLTGFPFPSQSYAETGIRLLRGSNVKRGVTDWSEEITQYWPQISAGIKEYVLQVGDIVIAMDGSLVGRSFAQLTDLDLPALLLQRVARIRSNFVDMGFLKEQICCEAFTEYCDSVKTVTAIPHISPKDIRDFKIPLAPTRIEQQAIAAILSDMDVEIVALEAKLAKARQVKQGMMQELLTGRIRLV